MEPARAERPSRLASRRPPRYSALGLLRRGLTGGTWPPPGSTRCAPSYDVVIIGGGVHGLAAAYYLAAKHGITNVAVLDQGYIGSGGSGRNTAILRSNYLTPEGVRFYDRSLELYRTLAAELDFNVMFSRRGHLTLAHNDSSLRTMRWRAEVNKLQGVDSEVIGPAEIKQLGPAGHVGGQRAIRSSARSGTRPAGSSATTPWSGATPAARRLGVHIQQNTEVTGIDVVRRAGQRGAYQPRRHRDPRRPQRDRGLVDAGGRPGRRGPAGHHVPAAGRGDRAGTAVPHALSCPARCTCTSARPTGASWSSAPASTRSPRTRCGARWSSSRTSPDTSWS